MKKVNGPEKFVIWRFRCRSAAAAAAAAAFNNCIAQKKYLTIMKRTICNALNIGLQRIKQIAGCLNCAHLMWTNSKMKSKTNTNRWNWKTKEVKTRREKMFNNADHTHTYKRPNRSQQKKFKFICTYKIWMVRDHIHWNWDTKNLSLSKHHASDFDTRTSSLHQRFREKREQQKTGDIKKCILKQWFCSHT